MTYRRAWLVRPPKVGNFDERAIETGIVTAEFGVREDLSDHLEAEMVFEEVSQVNACEKMSKVESFTRQLQALINDIEPGDLVIHPHDRRRCFAIGIVKPGAVQDNDGRPGRHVEWLRKSVSRDDLHPDLQHSLTSGLQVCEISRNNAVTRIEAIVSDGRDPGPAMVGAVTALEMDQVVPFLEDRMRRHVGSAFAGHALSHLVGCLLEAEGYGVTVMPPGPDGGCDLLASKGSLGIEGPTIAGQVKSGDIVVNHETLQALRGTIASRGADKGLLVSWSGVTQPVLNDLEALRLQIAYWDAAEICRRLLANYERMPLWVRDRVRIRTVPVLEAV